MTKDGIYCTAWHFSYWSLSKKGRGLRLVPLIQRESILYIYIFQRSVAPLPVVLKFGIHQGTGIEKGSEEGKGRGNE
jgi:hypothetical protein